MVLDILIDLVIYIFCEIFQSDMKHILVWHMWIYVLVNNLDEIDIVFHQSLCALIIHAM